MIEQASRRRWRRRRAIASDGRLGRAVAAVALVAMVMAGCTGGDAPTGDDTASAAPVEPGSATPSATDDADAGPAGEETQDETVELAAPARTAGIWASTIGLPVLGAVRTSTPLARLSQVPKAEWAAICAQVAAELDGIAPPPVLTALAVSADQETATLLVGDLRAKADLLAVCDEDDDGRDVLVEEVAATHEVAVAWLRAIGEQG